MVAPTRAQLHEETFDADFVTVATIPDAGELNGACALGWRDTFTAIRHDLDERRA